MEMPVECGAPVEVEENNSVCDCGMYVIVSGLTVE